VAWISSTGDLTTQYQVAETPHTQNGNGSKVSRKVCSKWLSLHKQCHKHAQRVKVVYPWATPVSQCYTKYITNRSMSITVILQQHETINSLFHTQKNKTPHELILSAGYTTLERTTEWDKGCPNCTCIWTEQVLCFLIDVLIELFYVFIKLS